MSARDHDDPVGEWRPKTLGDVPYLVAKIDAGTVRSPDGTLAWPVGFGMRHPYETMEDFAVLADMYRFPDDFPHVRREHAMRRCLKRIPPSLALTPDNVLTAIRSEVAAYESRPRVPFVVLTSLSLRWMPSLAARRIGSTVIEFRELPPPEFRMPQQAADALNALGPDVPSAHTWVLATTMARCGLGAEAQAVYDLDMLRGLWTLLLTHGGRTSSTFPAAISKLKLGPLYTVHRPDGSPARDDYWLERNYSRPRHLVNLRSKYARLVDAERDWLAAIGHTPPHVVDLGRCFVRYIRALDEADMATTAVHLWSVLEALTQTRKHEQVVRRVTARMERSEYNRIVLEHARRRRNHYVHVEHDGDAGETLPYRVKDYVEMMFATARHLGPVSRTKEEYLAFLDAPSRD
jgi:hypothetical protein